tara:strand:+ start:70 stop:1047 length:978 start_codon:yes stop_codon:yes gene_type:complete
MSKLRKKDVTQLAKDIIGIEVAALNSLKKSLDENLYSLCKKINETKGKVILIGVGKSGHIANKIAATLSSTGTPAIFLHPSEGMHGDIGVISRFDIVLLISNSGSTPEILNILPNLKKKGCSIMSLCGNRSSKIFEESDLSIDIAVKKEACPHDLAPTASTTTALVLGDVIAIILMKMKNFTAHEFGENHPGGQLGKSLNLKVKDIMHKGKDIPTLKSEKMLKDALLEMTKKNLGCVIIIDNNKASGFFTDGDLRRVIKKSIDIHSTQIKKIMNKKFLFCEQDDYATDTLVKMKKNKINSLPVLDKKKKVVGAINMHILVNSGIR